MSVEGLWFTQLKPSPAVKKQHEFPSKVSDGLMPVVKLSDYENPADISTPASKPNIQWRPAMYEHAFRTGRVGHNRLETPVMKLNSSELAQLCF